MSDENFERWAAENRRNHGVYLKIKRLIAKDRTYPKKERDEMIKHLQREHMSFFWKLRKKLLGR